MVVGQGERGQGETFVEVDRVEGAVCEEEVLDGGGFGKGKGGERGVADCYCGLVPVVVWWEMGGGGGSGGVFAGRVQNR